MSEAGGAGGALTRRAVLAAGGRGAVLSTLPVLLARPAFAHRQHLAVSRVVWSSESGTLEIEHRFYSHDLLAALGAEPEGAPDSFEEVRARARAALYVARFFALWDETGEPIALETIGAQEFGEYLVVYQESGALPEPRALKVWARALHDQLANQSNSVNVSFGDQVRTVTFAPGDKAKFARA